MTAPSLTDTAISAPPTTQTRLRVGERFAYGLGDFGSNMGLILVFGDAVA